MNEGKTHWEGCFMERGHETCLRHELQKHDCTYFDTPGCSHCSIEHPCTACRLQSAEAERDRLRKATELAAHVLEGYRMWDGLEWSWASAHPYHAERAWKVLRDALKGE